jgi:hypothetical protein
MATITSLSTLAKTSVSANDYLLIANSSVPTNYKFLASDFFPTMTTLGTSSEALFVSVTNKNTLNFKGIKSLNSLLTVATASNNITLQVNESLINLANCDNATAGFLSSVNLTTDVTGILPVANGGTGAATLTANSLILGNGTSALSALGVATNGQLVVGRTGLSPVLANLTAGTNVTITNGAGSITVAANLSTLTANLDAATYNIYRFSWLSGDGANEGIAVNSAGRVFVGSSTPTAFYTYDLNVNQSIALNGSLAQRIEMTTSSTPASLGIAASTANVSNVAGGAASLEGGGASGTGAGGIVTIAGGDAAGSGTGGNIVLDPGTSGSGTGGKTVINATGSAGPLANFVGTSGAASANSVSSSTASAAAKTGAIRIQINGVDAWIRVYASGE